MRYFYKIAYNGKSIGEVRAKQELKVQFRLREADAFPDKLNYKKRLYEKQRRLKKQSSSINTEPRILPILCCMLCELCRLFVNMQEQRWEIYSFLAVGKRGQGKALLQSWVLRWVKRIANVLFPKRWLFQFVFWLFVGKY